MVVVVVVVASRTIAPLNVACSARSESRVVTPAVLAIVYPKKRNVTRHTCLRHDLELNSLLYEQA